MEDYQKRVVEEMQELGDKMDRLDTFLKSSTVKLNANEWSLLHKQLSFMGDYWRVLRERVNAFTNEEQQIKGERDEVSNDRS